jgi:hypothetical protein
LDGANRELTELRREHNDRVGALRAELDDVMSDRENIGRQLMEARELLIARNEDREQLQLLKEHVRGLQRQAVELQDKISSGSNDMRTDLVHVSRLDEAWDTITSLRAQVEQLEILDRELRTEKDRLTAQFFALQQKLMTMQDQRYEMRANGKAGVNVNDGETNTHQTRDPYSRTRDSAEYRANGESDPMDLGTPPHVEPRGGQWSQTRESGTRYREGFGVGMHGNRYPENGVETDRSSTAELLNRGSREPKYGSPPRPQSPNSQPWVPRSKTTSWTKYFLSLQCKANRLIVHDAQRCPPSKNLKADTMHLILSLRIGWERSCSTLEMSLRPFS